MRWELVDVLISLLVSVLANVPYCEGLSEAYSHKDTKPKMSAHTQLKNQAHGDARGEGEASRTHAFCRGTLGDTPLHPSSAALTGFGSHLSRLTLL